MKLSVARGNVVGRMCFKMIKWEPPISYILLNSTHITSQRLKSTFLSPPVHHSSTAHLTYTDIAPAIICFHRLLINHIWKILWSHLPAHFLSKEKQTRVIRHFHFHGWPEVGIPAEGKGMIDIIASVQRQQQQSGNHPIIVHCRYLGTHLSLLYSHTGICVFTAAFCIWQLSFLCSCVLQCWCRANRYVHCTEQYLGASQGRRPAGRVPNCEEFTHAEASYGPNCGKYQRILNNQTCLKKNSL